MEIATNLNLVFPIRWKTVEKPDPADAKKTISVDVPLLYVYHTPIGREAFDLYYRIIAGVKTAIFSKGISYAADCGPRIAAQLLADVAKADALEWGIDDLGPGLRAELKRLSSVLVPDAKDGLGFLPVDLALKNQAIDADEWREAEAAIVFFTSGYAMASRSEREAKGQACALVLGGSTTSLPPTEFLASLRTLTTAETSAPAETSLVPS